MDLFSENALSKLSKEEDKNRVFREEAQTLRIVSMSDPSTSLEYLLEIKQLFQRMLPKMPREYILRQVFDARHCTLSLNDSANRIIGGVCYKPAFDRNLVEIVFFAVDSNYHISGYGTFLFNCLKEICKRQFAAYLDVGDCYKAVNVVISDLSLFNVVADHLNAYGNSDNLYLLTYADNSAIGFFKKQGFTLHPVSSGWMRYIKDYEGGTLMECKLHRQINYTNKLELVRQARSLIFEKMRDVNEFHIVRKWDDRAGILGKLSGDNENVGDNRNVGDNGNVDDNRSINSRITGDNISVSDNGSINSRIAGDNNEINSTNQNNINERTREQFLYDFIFFLICSLQSNSSSWPFLEPVNTKDVPDYLDVITHPIDLSTISRKHQGHAYGTLDEFLDDVYLMVNNCYTYNGSETQYYRCGEHIQTALEEIIERYKDTITRWGYEY